MRLPSLRINRIVYATLACVMCIAVVIGGQQALAIGSVDKNEAERGMVQVIDAQDPLQNATVGTWQTMLRFDTPAKYEYQLMHWGAGRLTTGALKVEASSAYVILEYAIGNRSGAVAWRAGAASVGETYMAALLADGLWNAEEISLLWSPFMVSRWASQFASLEWRVGPGWAIRSGNSSQFTIDAVLRDEKGATIYRAHLETSEGRPLEIDVNLQLPLPKYIKWTNNASSTFEAILQ
jgi:hypothetical protein